MHFFVTGCAGFIGSHVVDRLLHDGHTVIGYDNLSTGKKQSLAQAEQSPHFQFIEGDILDYDKLFQSIKNTDVVFHLAANADVRFGFEHPRRDLEQNTLATFNVLEAMRQHHIKRIVFSSTGSVYGETCIIPTPEEAPFPVQTSLYGASKLAAEGLIQAYCEGYNMQSYLFRFVSILGERYSHGHVIDFYQQLKEHPEKLIILGNGKQKKSYLYVQDAIDAMLLALEKANARINIFNLGTDEYCEVNDSVDWICNHLKLNPTRQYSGGHRGWIGDNPFIFLDCSRIRSLGWKPRLTIRESVIKTVDYLKERFILEE